MRTVDDRFWGLSTRVDEETWQLLLANFDAGFYRTQNPSVIGDRARLLGHYLSVGWKENLRPHPSFDPQLYLERHVDVARQGLEPFTHFLTRGTAALRARDAQPDGGPDGEEDNAHGVVARLRAMRRHLVETLERRGWTEVRRELSPAAIDLAREHFDERYYRATYPEVAQQRLAPLYHYLTVGWREGKNPNAAFSTRLYRLNHRDIRESRMHPFIHYLRYGRYEKHRSVSAPRDEFVLERFEAPKLTAAVARALSIEPMVGLPAEPRRIVLPHVASGRLAAVARRLRVELAGRRPTDIVFVPHLRGCRAARVAAALCTALAALKGPQHVLLVHTDSAHADAPSDISPDVHQLNLAELTQMLTADHALIAVHDLIRGTGAKRIYAVESDLLASALRVFGRQLAQEVDVVSFVSDRAGEVGGAEAPLSEWLRQTVEHHSLILTDSEALAQTIRVRFGLTEDGRNAAAAFAPAAFLRYAAASGVPHADPAPVAAPPAAPAAPRGERALAEGALERLLHELAA